MVNWRLLRWVVAAVILLMAVIIVGLLVASVLVPWMGPAVVVVVLTGTVASLTARRRAAPVTSAPHAAEQLRRRVLETEYEQLRLTGEMPSPQFGLSPGEEVPGPHYLNLVDLYARLHLKRVLLVGGPGSGKTTAAREFVARLAARSSSSDAPVPVLVGLVSWNPASEGVEDWFTDRIADRYGLRRKAVRLLVAERRLIPVLDGLDELPASQRTIAVPLLARWLAGFEGCVLTCRTSAHEELAGLLRLTAGMTVTLRPLGEHAIAGHLTSAGDQRWRAVATAVVNDPGGPLAEALSSPWLLSLAVSGYDGHRDPTELIDRTALPDAVAVRQRIVDTADPTASILGRYGKAGRSRLELLTDAMGRESDGLLLWWRMAEKYSTWRTLAYLCVALLGIPLLLFQAADIPTAARVLAVGSVLSTAAFTAFQITEQKPSRTGRYRWSPPLLGGRLPGWVPGLVAGLVLGVLYPVMSAPFLYESPSEAGAAAEPLVLAACVVSGLVFMFTGPDATPGRGRRAGDLRADLWASLLAATAVTVLTCLPLGHAIWSRLTANRDDLTVVLACVAPPVGIFATVLLAGSAWGRFRLTHLRLALEGQLPLRLGRFLADATERGLLVPADGYGAGCHAFRHDLIREALTGHGADRRAHLRATERFRADILADVLTLPESVAHLARASDGAPETNTREAERVAELTDEVLTEDLRSVADRGFEAYERYRSARERIRSAMRIPLWALPVPSFCYGILALVLGGVAVGTRIVANDPNSPTENTALGLLVGLGLLMMTVFVKAESSDDPEDRLMLLFTRSAMVACWCLAAGGLLTPLMTDRVREPLLWTATALAAPFALAWLYAHPHRARAQAVLDDDPDNWPDLPSALSRYRDAALHARESWLAALAREGVMPLIRGRLRAPEDTGTTPALPAVAPARLTGTRRSDQFVDTAPADEIAFHLRELDSASIGVSGPRGAGKSSLMQRFCTPGTTSAADDLLVLVPAPTSYDPREFLIHLFAEVCRKVTGDGPAEDGNPRFDPTRHRTRLHGLGAALTTAVGVLLITATLLWPHLPTVARGITDHTKVILISVGAALTMAGIGWTLRPSLRALLYPGTRRTHTAEAAAAAHLRTLHYQLTVMRTRTAQLALPGGLQVADGGQTQHTQHVLAYPELVARFRTLLEQVAVERRKVGGRVVIGIDELDKLGSAQETERFLNDLKVVFGIRGCHFLVAVSEDALTAFGRHVLDVRTVFDSAFDRVVAVRPLGLDQARTLLELRGVWLPEPYLWLCQILSGGLPRDLLRAVTSLATDRALRNTTDMRRLMTKLIEDDARSVLSAQTRYAATLTGDHAPSAARWIADASQAEVGPEAWENALASVPAVPPDEYETARAVAQVRSYLALGATLMRIFTETAGSVLTNSLERLRASGPGPVDLLTTARAKLATEPESSWAALTRCRHELSLLDLPEPP